MNKFRIRKIGPPTRWALEDRAGHCIAAYKTRDDARKSQRELEVAPLIPSTNGGQDERV